MIRSKLKERLDNLVEEVQCDYLHMDPLELVRQFSDPLDQEIAGFIAAALAIGRYALIRKAVEEIFSLMGASPARFILEFHPEKYQKLLNGFVYRFYRGRDIALLFWWMKQILQETSSLQSFFIRGYDPDNDNIGITLSRFVRSILSLETYPIIKDLPPKGSSIRHFLADPRDGSGCKRLNLFLRWMVRKDGVDLGLWNQVSPAKLIIPLDTHVARLGKRLGLTRRISPDWKMAVEITRSLRCFDPDDPVKYDFALCTIGKLVQCPEGADWLSCRCCPVLDFCQKVDRRGNEKRCCASG